MTANVRQTLGRSTAYSITGVGAAESAVLAAGVQYQGTDLKGPLGLRELRVKKTAGGAATIAVRVYNDASKTVKLLEDSFTFTADDEYDSFQPGTPVLLADTEIPFVTAEATAGAGHAVAVTLDFENATRA